MSENLLKVLETKTQMHKRETAFREKLFWILHSNPLTTIKNCIKGQNIIQNSKVYAI